MTKVRTNQLIAAEASISPTLMTYYKNALRHLEKGVEAKLVIAEMLGDISSDRIVDDGI